MTVAPSRAAIAAADDSVRARASAIRAAGSRSLGRSGAGALHEAADLDDQAIEADGDAADQANQAKPRHVEVLPEIIAAEDAGDDR